MAAQAVRLDRGIVGLTLMAGAAVSMGFIQLLAKPLEDVSSLNVQVLAVQTTTLAAPLIISLLLLLRAGAGMVDLGTRLGARSVRWRMALWRQQVLRLILSAMALVPYLLGAAMLTATLTRPEISNVAELRFLAGTLTPAVLVLSLGKTALFSGLILWITLDQGARAARLRVPHTAALSRAISLSIGVVLGLDITLALVMDPGVSAGLG
jgi:hypothetical protein